ncbi:MAG: hypothetical protein ACQR33_01755 [Candidatus Saccharibacteria bacterium]
MAVLPEAPREVYRELFDRVDLLEKNDPTQSVHGIAEFAVREYGLGLIGTVESTPIHEPVLGFMVYDRNFGVWDAQEDSQPEVRFTHDPDLAIMCGLFGDMNIRGQRALLGKSLTDKPLPHFGWEENDNAKQLIARPELIRAARLAGSTVMGSIDLVYLPEDEYHYSTLTGKKPNGSGERVIHSITSLHVPLHTMLSIPVRGRDMPKYVHPVDYSEILIPPIED